MAFNTGNAVPSTDGRDLSDNAETIDVLVNGTGQTTTARLGKGLSTINNLEQQYVFTAINSGVWAAGQTFTAVNQFMVFSGTAYKPKNSTILPYVVGASPVGDGNVEVVANLSTAQGDARYLKPTTLASAIADLTAQAGNLVIISDRANGLFEYKTGLTTNTFNIVDVDAPTLSLDLVIDDVLRSKEFGLKGDDSDETTGMVAFRDFISLNTEIKGVFTAGTYSYTVSPNWAIAKMQIEFDGDVTFHNTGVGSSLVFDTGPAGNTFDFRFGWGNRVNVDGDATTNHGVFIRSCHHNKIGANVRGCGAAADAFKIEFSVLGEYDFVASVNQTPFTTQPARGIHLTRRGVGGEHTSACIFYNAIVEGVSGVGIFVDFALKNQFITGTSEGNVGDNIQCTLNSRNNTFNGIDLEKVPAGVTVGIRDAGRRNSYLDVLNDSKTIFEVGSLGSRITGGVFDEIQLLGGRAKLLDVEYGSVGGEIILEFTGTHDGASNVAVLSDSTASFGVNDLVGLTVSNITDGSTATITANTATTVTGILSGGTDDDWDAADAYEILGDTTASIKDCFDLESSTYKQINLVRGKGHFTDVATAGAFAAPGSVPGSITKTAIPLAGVKIGDNITLVSQTAPAAGFDPGPTAVCTVDGQINITFVQLSGVAVSPLPGGGNLFTVSVDGS